MSTVDDIIAAAAQKYGVDPNALRTVGMIESHLNPNAVNAKSGASGLFQFMPATAKQYGLADPLDPQANAEAGAHLMADDSRGLTKALGHTPSTGELYLAHQQGLGGARALLADPGADAVDALASAYGGDRAKAERAFAMNGGKPGMTAAQFAGMWESKAGDAPSAAPQNGDAPTPMPPIDRTAMAAVSGAPAAAPTGIAGMFADALPAMQAAAEPATAPAAVAVDPAPTVALAKAPSQIAGLFDPAGPSMAGNGAVKQIARTRLAGLFG